MLLCITIFTARRNGLKAAWTPCRQCVCGGGGWRTKLLWRGFLMFDCHSWTEAVKVPNPKIVWLGTENSVFSENHMELASKWKLESGHGQWRRSLLAGCLESFVINMYTCWVSAVVSRFYSTSHWSYNMRSSQQKPDQWTFLPGAPQSPSRSLFSPIISQKDLSKSSLSGHEGLAAIWENTQIWIYISLGCETEKNLLLLLTDLFVMHSNTGSLNCIICFTVHS